MVDENFLEKKLKKKKWAQNLRTKTWENNVHESESTDVTQNISKINWNYRRIWIRIKNDSKSKNKRLEESR